MSKGNSAQVVRLVLARVLVLNLFLSLLREACSDEMLNQVFGEHRGRSYERKIPFSHLIQLLFDALIPYGTSAAQILRRREVHGELEATQASYYRKLSKVPSAVSCALVAEAAAHLRNIRPKGRGHAVPNSLQGFNLLRIDGKAIKHVAKRMQPARPFRAGTLLGGKCVLGFECESGLVTVMHGVPDGESNDLPLVPGLWASAAALPGPLLAIADAQYCDLKQPGRFTQRPGDHWLVRYHPKITFCLTESIANETTQDAEGRTVISEWGELQAQRQTSIPVRRIRVLRPGQDELILVTSLTESHYKTLDVLEAYFRRWDIEEMLAKVSQVFDLRKLISSSARGTILQLALCVLLYNTVEVLRQWLTPDGKQPKDLSIQKLYGTVRRELTGVTALLTAEEITAVFTQLSTSDLRGKLEELVGQISIEEFLKSPNKPRKPPTPKRSIPHGHTSIERLMHPKKPES